METKKFMPLYEKEDFIPFLKAGGRAHPEEIRFVYQRIVNDAPVFFSFATPQEFLELFDVDPENTDTLCFHMFSYGGEIYEGCKDMHDLERFAITKSIESEYRSAFINGDFDGSLQEYIATYFPEYFPDYDSQEKRWNEYLEDVKGPDLEEEQEEERD